MEKLKINKDNEKLNLKEGEEYSVLRNIMGECVIIRKNAINLILSEKETRRLGALTGAPALGGV